METHFSHFRNVFLRLEFNFLYKSMADVLLVNESRAGVSNPCRKGRCGCRVSFQSSRRHLCTRLVLAFSEHYFCSFSDACGLTTFSAARRTTQCKPCCTSTSVTRLWVRPAVWRWWDLAETCLRPAVASWSSTCRSARLYSRHRPPRVTFTPKHPLLRPKSTHTTRSSAQGCEKTNVQASD